MNDVAGEVAGKSCATDLPDDPIQPGTDL